MSIDSLGQSVRLQAMSQIRQTVSLSGLASLLVALGGWNNYKYLKICEKFFVIMMNKWIGLPSLNSARFWPGSLLLQSKRVFCFCGGQRYHNLNSIEELDLEREGQWKTLPLN